jgi:glycosyltransferase involved in cell wall biosynthesis
MADQSKKILYLITKSNYGGAQKYVFELATQAKAAGFRVVVAAGGTGEAGAAPGHLLEKLVKEDIHTRHISYFQRNMSPFDDVRAFFEVWKLLRKEKPDVLHVTSSKAGGIGALAGRMAGIPKIIFTSHGLTVDEIWRPRWQRILIYLSTWLTLRLADQSIMISTETYERASAMPGLHNRVTLIANGIAPISFLERKVARLKLAPTLPPTALWVGGVGELHPNKNWAMAIIALANLPKHIHLFIIGDGEERPILERLITHHHLQSQVHLIGYLDAPQYFKAFDIFLLPSLKEGLPYVLLEAGLAELPTIASDLPGNRDIITSGETGLLITPTPPLLATTLEMLSRDDGMRRRLGHAHKLYVEKHFSIDRMCQQTFALYASSAVDA